jgi:hypothetical protein
LENACGSQVENLRYGRQECQWVSS